MISINSSYVTRTSILPFALEKAGGLDPSYSASTRAITETRNTAVASDRKRIYIWAKCWEAGSNRVYPNMDLRGIGLGQASTNTVGEIFESDRHLLWISV